MTSKQFSKTGVFVRDSVTGPANGVPSAVMLGHVLLVDDNQANLDALSRILKRTGYVVTTAQSGAEALSSVKASMPELVLLDVEMPEMSGLEVCRRLKLDPVFSTIPIVFVSGHDDPTDRVMCFDVGGVDFIAKPYARSDVIARVQTHMRLSRMQSGLRAVVDEQSRDLNESARQYRLMFEQTITAMARLMDQRDPYTAGHQLRVAAIAVAIGTKLGWSDDRLLGLRLGAEIHDIGKIRVPAEILNRPGKLTDIEFLMLHTHCAVGGEIIREISFPWPIMEMVTQHHERIDGSGYPAGLVGDEISHEARVLAVADVVEAMASHRPYRAALGIDRALGELRRGRGTSYDAEAVDVCCALFESGDLALQP